MARIIEYEETSVINPDDYLIIDGTTDGSRKIKPNIVGPIDEISELQTFVIRQIPVTYTKFGTASFPYGWRTGYYPSGGGSVINTSNFICSLNSSIPLDGVKKVTITPPTGRSISVHCIKGDGTIVELGHANSSTHPELIDVPVSFYTNDYVGYNVTIGYLNAAGIDLVKDKSYCESISIVEERVVNYVNKRNKKLVYSKSDLVVGSLQTSSRAISITSTEAFTVGKNRLADLIPLVPFQSVTLVVPPIEDVYYTYRIGFYDSSGTQIGYFTATRETTFAQRTGGAYIAVGVFAYNQSDDTKFNDFLAAFPNDVAPITIIRNDEYDDVYVTEDGVEQAINSIINSSDIATLNDDLEEKLKQAVRPINLSQNGYLSASQPLVLAWMSDIHGDVVELGRFVELMNKYSSYLDDAICTGDLVYTRWTDGFDYWDEVDGSENILLAIGNHDVLTDESTYDWTQRASQSQQHSRYIEPFYSNWNVTSDVATSGLTYYYKDYANKAVRLIVINEMLDGEDLTSELTWFTSVLSEANTNNLNVVIAKHCPLYNSTKLECNWSNIDRYSTTSYLPTGSRTIFTDAVDTFISNGGKFICYICGHTHWDQISKFVGTNGTQLSIGIDAINRVQANQYSDTQRTDGTKSQDLINIIAFDTSSECIKVIRVGANMDHYLRLKNVLTIKYDGTIVSQV